MSRDTLLTVLIAILVCGAVGTHLIFKRKPAALTYFLEQKRSEADLEDPLSGRETYGDIRDRLTPYYDRARQEKGIDALEKRIQARFPEARVRTLGTLVERVYELATSGGMTSLTTRGLFPAFHLKHDFDCDGKDDDAVLLDKPRSQLVILPGDPALPLIPLDAPKVDELAIGEKGDYSKPAADGAATVSLVSQCDVIQLVQWEKSPTSVVYDANRKAFELVALDE
ncbi:MAG: hypothetical protein AB7P04_06390 [Bacteriovoracia bacterium]